MAAATRAVLAVGVLDDADADDRAVSGDHRGDAAQDPVEAVVLDRPVVDAGARVLAKPDQEHLGQPALHPARELRVGLDAVADHHVVGGVRMLVEVNREALGRLADDDGGHGGADGTAAGPLGDAVGFEDRPLAAGGAAAVAAHGGHQERLRAEPAKPTHDRAEDRGDVGDAAAAGGDRHGLPRPDHLVQPQLRELPLDCAGNVFDPWRVEPLADAEHAWVVDDASRPYAGGTPCAAGPSGVGRTGIAAAPPAREERSAASRMATTSTASSSGTGGAAPARNGISSLSRAV